MPFHSQLSQGADLLRQFFTQLVPGFSPSKEKEFQERLTKVNRLPGMSIQEGLSFSTNKTSPFIPDFNGSGPFPFMFVGGYLPGGGGSGGGGIGTGGGGGGDDEPYGGWGPPPGGGDPPPDPPDDGSSSDGTGSSSSDSSGIVIGGSDSDSTVELSANDGSDSGSGSVIPP